VQMVYHENGTGSLLHTMPLTALAPPGRVESGGHTE
jgi:hypothetical protein